MKKWILKGLIIQYDMRKKFVCVPSMNNNFNVGKMRLKYRNMLMVSVQCIDACVTQMYWIIRLKAFSQILAVVVFQYS